MMNKLLINSALRLVLGGVSYYLMQKGFSADTVSGVTELLTNLLAGVTVAGGAMAWSASEKKVNVSRETIEDVNSPQPVIFIPDEQVKPPKGWFLSNRSLNVLDGVDIRLKEIFTTAIIDSPYDFTCYHGKRSDAEQAEMLQAGKSWVSRSKHQDGLAVDFFIIGGDGKPLWDTKNHETYKKYCEVGEHLKSVANRLGYPVVYGGDWKKRDMVHLELV